MNQIFVRLHLTVLGLLISSLNFEMEILRIDV